MNTTEYKQRCIELDRELATLLGWTIRNGHLCGLPPNYTGTLWSMPVPRWTQSDADAFRLAVEHDVFPELWIGQVWIGNGDDKHFVCEDPVNFSDKITAFRFAIVQAVINKLKGNV